MVKNHSFGITVGSGTRPLGAAFRRPANAAPLSLIVDQPAPPAHPPIDPQLSQLVPVAAGNPSDIPNGNWLEDHEQPQYSEKIKVVKALFEEERAKQKSNYLYVRLTRNGKITPLKMVIDHTNIRDLNNFVQSISPGSFVVMGLNLYEDFDEQIQSGDFDPRALKSWESLKTNPLDCITPLLEIQKQVEAAPTTLGPNRPVIVWDNKP